MRGLGPGVGQARSGAVDGVGRVAQMLLGVVDVDDFDGAGEPLGDRFPDPGDAAAEDDRTLRGVETAPLRLAMDALRKAAVKAPCCSVLPRPESARGSPRRRLDKA